MDADHTSDRQKKRQRGDPTKSSEPPNSNDPPTNPITTTATTHAHTSPSPPLPQLPHAHAFEQTQNPTTGAGQQMTTVYGPRFTYTCIQPPSLDIDAYTRAISIRGHIINVLANFNSSVLKPCLYELSASFIGVGTDQCTTGLLEAVDYPNKIIRVQYRDKSIEALPFVLLSQVIYLPHSPPPVPTTPQDVHQYATVWHAIVYQRVFIGSAHRCPLRLMPALRVWTLQWQAGCFLGLENERQGRGQTLEEYVLETHAYNKRTSYADTEITRLCTLMVQKRDENARNGYLMRMDV